MSDQLNIDLGEEYKDKLGDIAKEENRSMTGQIRAWIDRFYPEVEDK